MLYTEELNDQGIKKFKNIVPEEIIKKIYPNSKYTIDFAIFRKSGYAGWPTWIIGFNRNENFEWRGVISISGTDSFNKEFHTGTDEIIYEPETFLKELEKSDDWFDFFYRKTLDSKFFHIVENYDLPTSVRLNKALKDYGIKVFD